MPEMAIQTQKLTRRFGDLTAVDGIDLQVTAGQFFGFLGPNGAGKSTTIKILTGLLAPTSGSMRLWGVDFAEKPVEVKRQIGFVREGMGLFERLTGSEYLKFVGRMYGLDRPTTQRRSEELLDFMQLADRPKTMIADYSHGMQKKLALAAAVIHGPRILFLDEPFEGVDARPVNHGGCESKFLLHPVRVVRNHGLGPISELHEIKQFLRAALGCRAVQTVHPADELQIL